MSFYAIPKNGVETSSLNPPMARIMLAPCSRSLSSCLPRVFQVTCKDASHGVKEPPSFSVCCSCWRLGKRDRDRVRWEQEESNRRGLGNSESDCYRSKYLEMLLCPRYFHSTMRKSNVLLLVVSLERTVLVRGAPWHGGSYPFLPASWSVPVFNGFSCSDPWQTSDAVGLGSSESSLRSGDLTIPRIF